MINRMEHWLQVAVELLSMNYYSAIEQQFTEHVSRFNSWWCKQLKQKDIRNSLSSPLHSAFEQNLKVHVLNYHSSMKFSADIVTLTFSSTRLSEYPVISKYKKC